MEVGFIVGTLGPGGAERQLMYMLSALQKEKVKTRILCLTRGEAFEGQARDLGVPIEWVGAYKSRVMRLLTIIENVRRRPVDILQSTHFYTNLYAAATGRILGIPNIGAIRSDLSYEFATNRKFGELQLKLPRHLISNSQVAMDRAISRGISEEGIDLLKNVVETADTVDERPREFLTVLFAGRLTPEKRPDLFIEMAIRLIREVPQCTMRFVIAGDGPLRDELQRSVLTRGFSEQIEFVGHMTDLGEIYARTDLLVLTSDHEGTPNVVLEAMARGIAVLATDVGGVPAILSDGVGCIVKPGCADELVSAATKLIRDRELRQKFGENGRRFVKENHSFDMLGKQLKEIYCKLVAPRRIDVEN